MSASDCIIWPGGKDQSGYGKVKINGRDMRAHRVALAQRLGRELQRWEIAMHRCNNKSCVNPDHLEVGTIAENNRQVHAAKSTLAKRVLGIDAHSGVCARQERES